jgi:hypothetical protein
MFRRIMIALASVIFLGAVAAATTAEARMGGRGGGVHGGSFHGGMTGVRGGFVGSRFAARHHAFHHRFHHRRFAFAAVPFVVGPSCWVVRSTPWGLRRVYVCGDIY